MSTKTERNHVQNTFEITRLPNIQFKHRAHQIYLLSSLVRLPIDTTPSPFVESLSKNQHIRAHEAKSVQELKLHDHLT